MAGLPVCKSFRSSMLQVVLSNSLEFNYRKGDIMRYRFGEDTAAHWHTCEIGHKLANLISGHHWNFKDQ